MAEKKIKHLDDCQEKQIQLSGYHISYKKPYELLHTYEDIFSKEIYRFNSDSEQPLIFDCGSNIGFSILYFKKIFPSSKIVAYEADENNYGLLKKNVERNHLQNVDLRNKAVWIHDDGVQFSAKGTEASKIAEGDGDGAKTVSSERLASVLAGFEKIDFLKMDIEGAEYDVVKDCAPYLSRIENMFIEYHGTVEETDKLNQLLAIFSKSGFRVYIKNAADFLLHPYIDKKVNSIYDVQLNIFCYK
ncbi:MULTISPECIES: FkbM family methyltransferase [Chitinophagaceae]